MFELKRLALICGFLAAISAAPCASAGEPTRQLSATINEFVEILATTPVAQLRATGLPEKALALVFSRFDFGEMTRRSLGPHWEALDVAERREFVDAFTQRLLTAYGRSVRASGNEKVRYERESQDGDYASVDTKVISNGGSELAIAYRMRAVDGQWKVYDMVIDHVSIVNNYRVQFNRVIARSSLQDLLRKMKDSSS